MVHPIRSWSCSPGATLFLPLAIALLLSSAQCAYPAQPANGGYPLPCGSPTDIKVRLPPSLDRAVDTNPPSWVPPPQDWLYGNWKITYSTNKKYVALENLEFDNTPTLPTCFGAHPADCPPGSYPGQNVDLRTWTMANENMTVLASAFGYDTPHRVNHPHKGRGWDAVYDFNGTGVLAGLTNSWELLAYGYDENGAGYIVAYETEPSSHWAPPAIDIESRSPTGPSHGTYQAILHALEGLHNKNVDKMLANMTALVTNGARDSLPPFVCTPACVNNTQTPTG